MEGVVTYYGATSVVNPSNCQRRCALTITGNSHSLVKENNTYAVLFTGEDSTSTAKFGVRLPTEMFTLCQNGGGDICFTSDSAGSNQLPLEIVSFNASGVTANQTAEIWVAVPLTTAADATIYVWYQTTGGALTQPAAASTYGSKSVWNGTNGIGGASNYLAYVSHDGGVTDSTGNYTDSANTSTVNSSGYIGTAANFNGSQYIQIGSANAIVTNTGTFTAQLWEEYTSVVDTVCLLSLYGTAHGFLWCVGKASNSNLSGAITYLGVRGSTGLISSATANDIDSNQNVWNQHALSYNGGGESAGNYVYNINGSAVTQTTTSAIGGSANANYVGEQSSSSLMMVGNIDELRLTSTNRTSNYLVTDYNIQHSTNLITVGTATAAPALTLLYALTVSVDTIGGSGTYGSWNVSLAGQPGLTAVASITLSNGAGGTATIGQPVYITGADQFTIAKAVGTPYDRVVGLVSTASITSGNSGSVQTTGVLTATTTQWTAITDGSTGLTSGSVFYLSPTTAGNITSTAPAVDSVRVGIALSTTDFEIQLNPPTLIIASNVSLYVATTGNDSTGTGAVGAPWATLAKALSYLAVYAITPAATVTIYLGDGNYATSAAIAVNHPNGDRINITGTNAYATTLSGSITSFSLPSGGTSTAVINVVSAANMVVNDYVLIQNASGGTHGWLLNGCHQITNINGTAITITVNSYSVNQASGAISATVNTIKTRLTFSGCHGIQACDTGGEINYRLGNLNQIILVGPGTTTYNGIVGGTFGFGTLVGLSNWHDGILPNQTSSINCAYACVSGCFLGLVVVNGSVFNFNNGVVNGCTYGIYVQYGSTVFAQSAFVVGNSSNGVNLFYSSSINLTSATVCDNAGNGVAMQNMCFCNATSATINYNSAAGISATLMCSVLATSSTVNNNGTYGFATTQLSFATTGTAPSGNGTAAATPTIGGAAGNNGSYNI